MNATRPVLYSETEIAARVQELARSIARFPAPPQIMVPVLTGAFVFAADLSRALAREGLDLPVEFLWLRRYGLHREGGEMKVLAGPGETVTGARILLIDGVLDHGHTLRTARDLLLKARAISVMTAVVLDKRRAGAPIAADLSCFSGSDAFVVGYGMDDAGMGRGLPQIVCAN